MGLDKLDHIRPMILDWARGLKETAIEGTDADARGIFCVLLAIYHLLDPSSVG